MSADSIQFGIVAEAASDARRGRMLVDRAIREAEPTQSFLDGLDVDLFRRWVGLFDDEDFLDIHDVPSLAREHRLTSLGHFSDEKAAKDAHLVRKTLMLFKRLRREIHALVILRDTDGLQEQTEQGFEQAITRTAVPFPVLRGLPHEAMESWLLAGYQPANGQEQQVLDEIRQDLGYWPNREPHRLSHKKHVKHSAKTAVWDKLCDASSDTLVRLEERCLVESDRHTLEKNGKAAGLTGFLEVIKDDLVPLIGG